MRYIGSLLAEGESVLIFPEGRRSEDDEVLPFRPGIGMVGALLDVPIVPVRIEGRESGSPSPCADGDTW